MAFIKKSKIKGKVYYYHVESYRDGPKVKHRILDYYGRQDPGNLKKDEKKEGIPFTNINIDSVYSAGPMLCVLKLMIENNACKYIDETINKRQGLPVGFTLFTIAAHKLFGFDPSLNNISSWLEDSALQINEKIDVGMFRTDNINYIFDKLFEVHGAVETLENIQADLFNQAKKRFNINEKNLYYDVTSTYFEGNKSDDGEYGISKDGKGDKKQLNIGLVATKDRKFPVFSKVFKGNVSEKSTVIEIVTMLKYIYKFKDITAIMDRGMISKDNIVVLDANDFDYILGATSAVAVVKKMIINTSKKKILKEGVAYHTKKGICVYALALNKTIYSKHRRMIILYNESMANDQIETIEQKIEQANNEFKSHSHSLSRKKIMDIEKLGKPYVQIIEKDNRRTLKVDKTAVSEAKKRAGKSALVTTLDDSANEVVEEYFAKDIVEKIFRFSKQYATLRPVRRILSGRVKSDIFLSFLGYYIIAFIRELLVEKGIKVTDEKLLSELPKIRLVVKRDIKKNKTIHEIIGNTKFQKKIIDALEFNKSVDYIKNLRLHKDLSSET